MGLQKDSSKPVFVSSDEIEDRFGGVVTTQNDNDRANWRITYEDRYSELARRINDTIEDSREKSLALTALEESHMWLGKALYKENSSERV